MTLSPEQFRERLIGYLYGELEGDELAAFEACLAESEAYRRELESMRDTLQRARSGLAELEQNPPARVRRGVLDFAAEQVAEAPPARHPQVAAARGGAAAPVPRMGGFFAWLRNPGFITATGFATLALLAILTRKSILAPQRDYAVPPAPSAVPSETREETRDLPPDDARKGAREGGDEYRQRDDTWSGSRKGMDKYLQEEGARNAAREKADEAAGKLRPSSPSDRPGEPRPASSPSEHAGETRGGLGAASSETKPARRQAAAAREYAAPPPAWKAAQPAPAQPEALKRAAAPSRNAAQSPAAALAPAPEPAADRLESPAAAQKSERESDALAAPAAAAPAPERAAGPSPPASSARPSAAEGSSPKRVARPGSSPTPARPSAADDAAKPRAPADAAPPPAATSGATRDRQIQARPRHAAASSDSADDEALSSSELAPAALPGAEVRPNPYLNAPNDLVQRAREHLDQGRPREAVRAYQDLLKRFPRDPRAAEWRKQLALANRVLAQ